MSEQLELRIAGIGGQGVVIAADLIGEAALLAGRQVAGSSRYGSAARGTPVRADLVLADAPIDDPHVHTPDVLLVFNQEAYDLYAPGVRSGGQVLYDAPAVTPTPRDGIGQHGVPALQTALSEEVGNRQCANLVLVGALLGLTELLPRDALETAIRHHVRERFWEVNLQALALGVAQGQGLERG